MIISEQVRVECVDERSAFRGWARLDTEIMELLNISTGEIIKIKGEKVSGVIVIPAKKEDYGTNIIRLDGITRDNCDVRIGDIVTIERIDVKTARTVTLVPKKEYILIQELFESIKNNLINRPVNKGDIISYWAKRPRRRLITSLSPYFFDEFFRGGRSRPSHTTLGEIRFLVQSTEPPNEIVQIVDRTKIIIPEESGEFLTDLSFKIHGEMKKRLMEILSEKFLKEITYKRIAYKFNIDEYLAQDLVEELLKSGEIKGKMMADKIILESNG
ncbi:MAG: hypothetical protein ACFFCM_00220 [Promethearchaeota archaeon]